MLIQNAAFKTTFLDSNETGVFVTSYSTKHDIGIAAACITARWCYSNCYAWIKLDSVTSPIVKYFFT